MYVFCLQLADDQPLEYLSEMRQVSIVFCQLATDGVSSELPSILQDAFVVMHKSVWESLIPRGTETLRNVDSS